MPHVDKKQIDRVSILRANNWAKMRIESTLEAAEKYRSDPNREKRKEMAECLVCSEARRIGGCAMTTAICGICGKELLFGNTCVDVLCLDCAKANQLCKHCGGDIDLKDRRKPRPYEARKFDTVSQSI